MADKLDHYLHHWHLTDPKLIAQTPTSLVYLVDRDAERVVLKLLEPAGISDEADGALALRYFGGDGAIHLLDYDEGAHLLEYVSGEELATLVWQGHDTAAAQIIADTVNKLHRPRSAAPAPRLRTLRHRFLALFEQAASDEAAGNETLYVRAARVAEHSLASPQNECVLHGDIQHHNIRQHPTRGWLAYDAKGLYGERTYDAANAVCNPMYAEELTTSEERMRHISQVLAEGMGISVDRLRAFVFVHACLACVWDNVPASDTRDPVLKIARIAERYVDLAL